METEKKNGRGKKEVSLLGLFGKKFLEETQVFLFLLLIIRGSRLQRENKRKIFVKKGRKKIYAAVSVRLRERLQQRKVQLKTVRIFLLVQMDLFIWRFRLL